MQTKGGTLAAMIRHQILKMNLSFENIEFADNNVIEMEFIDNYQTLSISTENSYLIDDEKWLGETKIVIQNWEKLTVEKFVAKSPNIKGETYEVDWRNEILTFDMIQEVIVGPNELSLNGFSKQNGDWISYNFQNYSYNISKA